MEKFELNKSDPDFNEFRESGYQIMYELEKSEIETILRKLKLSPFLQNFYFSFESFDTA